MKGKKRIDSPRKKVVKCVGDRAHEEKRVESLKRTNDGRNFQFTKFSVIDFSLPTAEIYSGTQPNSACGKSSTCRFSFWATENAITKATE